MESTSPWRYRLNVSQSTKGVETSDATIEYTGENIDWETFLTNARKYHAEVRKMYPNPVEGQ